MKDFHDAYGVEKSAVSENFIEASREKVKDVTKHGYYSKAATEEQQRAHAAIKAIKELRSIMTAHLPREREIVGQRSYYALGLLRQYGFKVRTARRICAASATSYDLRRH